ncbi:hypothetical protein [Paenibacillus sp.]|uniref:hypothetical protein n=1 Tax=Paenibacillus sp. TaxID=58172 RepID=UPI002D6C6B78|nr:hypothetical protein [Paenibacillus sp.]HZG87306.1 hypothetical protein [Paenibacillus sp.]
MTNALPQVFEEFAEIRDDLTRELRKCTDESPEFHATIDAAMQRLDECAAKVEAGRNVLSRDKFEAYALMATAIRLFREWLDGARKSNPNKDIYYASGAAYSRAISKFR